MLLGQSHRAQADFAIHLTAPDRSKTYIGETVDISSSGFSVQVRTDDPLPPIILAGILPTDIPGDAIVCKARLVWRGGVVRGLKRASYRIISIAHRSQDRLDQLIQQSLAGLVAELGAFPPFAVSTAADLELLLALGRTREIAAGRTLYESSAGHAGIYIVLAGEVAVASPQDHAGPHGPGSIIGRWPGSPITEMTATVISDVRVLHLSPTVSAEIQQRMPRIVTLIQDALNRPAPVAPSGAALPRQMRVHLTRDLLEIPTPPDVFHALLDCLADPDFSGNDLAVIIEQEPALVGWMLGVLSGPPLGSTSGVDTIARAIEWLGWQPTANLALTGVLLQTLHGGAAEPLARTIWTHCIATGYFAHMIGEQMHEELVMSGAPASRPVPRVAAEAFAPEATIEPDLFEAQAIGVSLPHRRRLFLEGLLHDIGLLVMQQKFPEHFARVRAAIPRAGSLDRAEHELLEIDHGQIGYRVAKAWRLPEPIPAVIAAHHEPERWATSLLDREELSRRLRERPFVTAVSLADLMARRSEIGGELDPAPPEIPAVIPEALGLPDSEVQAILARAPIIRARVEAVLRG
jgi:HD-like signal output (HDOD) protein